MTFDQEMVAINEEIEKMFSLTREYLRRSLVYYLSDESIVFDTKIDDHLVNDCERNVEAWCLSILLREKVYATDLRRVTGCLKLVTDIERIGDHARDIKEDADKIKVLGEKGQDKDLIQEFVDYVLKMYDDSVKAFVRFDFKLAEEIAAQDNEVDSKVDAILDQLIKENSEKKVSGAYVVYQTLIIKYLERIVDHAVNIAEWVVFIKNGFHKDSVII